MVVVVVVVVVVASINMLSESKTIYCGVTYSYATMQLQFEQRTYQAYER